VHGLPARSLVECLGSFSMHRTVLGGTILKRDGVDTGFRVCAVPTGKDFYGNDPGADLRRPWLRTFVFGRKVWVILRIGFRSVQPL
jgi:hypothetical protein